MLSNRILSGESLLRHHVINHHHTFSVMAVLIGDESATKQRESHHIQVIRRDAVGKNKWLLARRRLSWRRVIRYLVVAFAHGHGINYGNRFNSRNAANVFERLLPCCASFGRIFQCVWGQRHAAYEHIMDIDTWVKKRQAQQRSSKNSGSHQKDHSKAKFSDDKTAVQPARLSCHAPRSGSQHWLNGANWDSQSRSEPKKNATEQGDADGKEQHMPVQVDFLCARQTTWPKRHKRANTDGRNDNA